jgi:cobalt ECF transporter T component CbiQ
MRRGDFLASTVLGFARALAHAIASEQLARQSGLLQLLDPRVRVAGLFFMVLAVMLSHKIAVVGGLFLVAVLIAVLSRVRIGLLAKRLWLAVLAFTGVIALPAIFLTPGDPVIFAGKATHITWQGLQTAVLLIMRVEAAATFTSLLVLCTPWTHVLKALRAFRLPPEAIMMLAMTHRYIFLLIETAGQIFESRQSRTVGALNGSAGRHITAGTAGVLLSKSMELGNEVYLAMQSRGFRGDIQVLCDFHMRARDYLGLLGFLFAGSISVWMGR